MNPSRILILTSSHLCRNPRVLKEATTLGAAGHDVTVMTISTTDRFEHIDRELISEQPFRRVTLDYRRSVSPWRNWRARSATWLARQALRRARVEFATALGPAFPLLARARAFPADLTIAHNEIALWAAERLAASGRRVAADFEDWYSEDLLERDRRARPLQLLKRAERFSVQRAAGTTTTSAAMANALASAYDGPAPSVVRNVFPLQADPLAHREGARVPQFIWFSQTVGPGRGLEEFIEAWNLLHLPSRLSLLGEISSGFREQLLALARPEYGERIAFLPLVKPDELPRILAGFDIGLALEAKVPRSKDLTISNKIFQYLNAGLAVVATPTAGQAEVMHRTPGSGVLVPHGDPARLASILDELLSNRERLHACQHVARAAATAEYCWEKESARLLAAVQRALER